MRMGFVRRKNRKCPILILTCISILFSQFNDAISTIDYFGSHSDSHRIFTGTHTHRHPFPTIGGLLHQQHWERNGKLCIQGCDTHTPLTRENYSARKIPDEMQRNFNLSCIVLYIYIFFHENYCKLS